MKFTRQCHGCRQSFRKEEMVQYFSPSGKTSYWFCPKCLEEKQNREAFSSKVCEIFALEQPGPRIWKERKTLQDTYGYTDETIIKCLDYIYNVEKARKIAETLALVTPASMERMRQWQASQNATAGSIAAAIANTEMKEYIVPIAENTGRKKEDLNPNNFLDD